MSFRSEMPSKSCIEAVHTDYRRAIAGDSYNRLQLGWGIPDGINQAMEKVTAECENVPTDRLAEMIRMARYNGKADARNRIDARR